MIFQNQPVCFAVGLPKTTGWFYGCFERDDRPVTAAPEGNLIFMLGIRNGKTDIVVHCCTLLV
jgi:hypothetical protein